MKPKNTICLWFDKDAHEAARFYAAARGMTCSIAARSRMSADERVVAPLATTGEYDDRQQRHHDQRLTYARIDEGGSKQRESQREHRHRWQQERVALNANGPVAHALSSMNAPTAVRSVEAVGSEPRVGLASHQHNPSNAAMRPTIPTSRCRTMTNGSLTSRRPRSSGTSPVSSPKSRATSVPRQ